eukprot:954044_1
MATPQELLDEMKGTIRKYTHADYDEGEFIVVPWNAELDGDVKFRVALASVNGGEQTIKSPFVQTLDLRTEVIKQLEVTVLIPELPLAKVGDVVDFSDSKFNLIGNPKSLEPFTVVLRHCPEAGQKEPVTGVKMEWFRLPKDTRPNCVQLSKAKKKQYKHLLESSPSRVYYPAVIGRRDGRNAGHAVANWIDPYAWYRVFY